jgi:hypothetical protein
MLNSCATFSTAFTKSAGEPIWAIADTHSELPRFAIAVAVAGLGGATGERRCERRRPSS